MFKKLLAALTASGIAFDEGQKSKLETWAKDNTPYKSFNTEDEYNEYLSKQQTEWKASEEARAAKESSISELLKKHKVDEKYAAKFKTLYKLDSVEADKLEEAIAAGKKESPEWLSTSPGSHGSPTPKTEGTTDPGSEQQKTETNTGIIV